jgi:peptide/nickel transport system substrate-binding protein
VGEDQVIVIPAKAGIQLLLIAALALPAGAASFRWSAQGDYLSADPHAQNEGTNNLINDQIFERLVAYDKKLGTIPSLATAWEQKSPTTWRFSLRKGVKFHDGTSFTASDVAFSLERAQQESSTFKVFAVPLGKARAIDSHTLEIETPEPSPAGVFLQNLHTLRIVSKAWCEKHKVVKPQDFKTGEETYASTRANGTGPFVLVKRESEVVTQLRKNPDWWGLREGAGDRRFEGNVDEIIYRPIKSNATRMAALLSGELDLVQDPALQDIPRLKRDPAVRIVEGTENRVIFLVLDQERTELKYSDVKGKNPLKDVRVRKALYHAIDIQGIRDQVMRGLAMPTGAMIPSPSQVFPQLEPRLLAYDPARARALLAEAGYPNGFSVGLLCPNDRYVNDERICTALAAMFAKIGVRIDLATLPRAQFFQRVDNFDHSIHLYGWGGAAVDPGFTLTPVIHSRDDKGRGYYNSGRYLDEALDRLIEAVAVEMDATKRRAMMGEAFARVRENVYQIPLHRQVIPWAVRANVKVVHRPDNVIEALWITVGK